MANRYWVGGTGTWDASNTDNWSATSGGASGASVPTGADAVIFDASSGGGTITLGYNPTVTSITMGAFTGTFDASTYSPSMATFSGTGTGVRTLKMGTGIWHLMGTGTIWDTSTTTNLTLDKGTAIIAVTDKGATGKTLTGGGLTFHMLFNDGTPASFTLTNIFFDYVILHTIAQTATLSFQDELNRLNSSTYLSINKCLNSLAGDANGVLDSKQAANVYAATDNLSVQDAINSKAGTTGLSKQNAAKLIP